MSNLQKYGDYSVDAAEDDRSEFDRLSGKTDFWNPPLGKSVFRAMPPRPGRNTIYRFVWQHFIEPLGGAPGQQQRKVVFVCPLMQSKQDKLTPQHCPACSYQNQLLGSKSGDDLNLAENFQSARRILINIVDRNNEEAGVQVYGFSSKKVYEQLDKLRKDQDAGGNFPHPTQGFDLIMDKSGSGFSTKYVLFPARNITPLHADVTVMEAWLESMPDLDRYARIPAPQELARLWAQAVPGMVGGGNSGFQGGGRGPAPQGRGGSQARGRTAADDAIDTEGVPTE